jgi:hypothetical protein
MNHRARAAVLMRSLPRRQSGGLFLRQSFLSLKERSNEKHVAPLEQRQHEFCAKPLCRDCLTSTIEVGPLAGLCEPKATP